MHTWHEEKMWNSITVMMDINNEINDTNQIVLMLIFHTREFNHLHLGGVSAKM